MPLGHRSGPAPPPLGAWVPLHRFSSMHHFTFTCETVFTPQALVRFDSISFFFFFHRDFWLLLKPESSGPLGHFPAWQMGAGWVGGYSLWLFHQSMDLWCPPPLIVYLWGFLLLILLLKWA